MNEAAVEADSRSWRPAAARPVVTARLKDDTLSLAHQDGSLIWELPLGRVEAVRLTHHVISGHIMMRLELTAEADTIRKLEINHPVRGPSQPLSDFTAMVVLVLGRLSDISPEVPYTLGETRGVSRVMVALGITMAIMGAGGAAVGIADGAILQGLGIGGAVFLSGLGIAAANLGASRELESRPLARALDEDAGV